MPKNASIKDVIFEKINATKKWVVEKILDPNKQHKKVKKSQITKDARSDQGSEQVSIDEKRERFKLNIKKKEFKNFGKKGASENENSKEMRSMRMDSENGPKSDVEAQASRVVAAASTNALTDILKRLEGTMQATPQELQAAIEEEDRKKKQVERDTLAVQNKDLAQAVNQSREAQSTAELRKIQEAVELAQLYHVLGNSTPEYKAAVQDLASVLGKSEVETARDMKKARDEVNSLTPEEFEKRLKENPVPEELIQREQELVKAGHSQDVATLKAGTEMVKEGKMAAGSLSGWLADRERTLSQEQSLGTAKSEIKSHEPGHYTRIASQKSGINAGISR